MRDYDYPDVVTARRIKAVIAEKGLTQGEVAKATNRERKTVIAWVNCVTSPSAYCLKKFCVKYNVSADWILGLSDVNEVSKKEQNETRNH